MSIAHPSDIDVDLQIQLYLTDMRKEYLPNDIFDTLSSEYINATGEEPKALPNAIYFKLSAEADKAHSCRVAMIKELSGAPTLAGDDQRLREEDWITKHFTMHYTDLSHATTNQAYGIKARDKAPYRIFEYRTEGLAKYFKQYFGKMRRQTLLERHSENLEMDPHYLTSAFSPNWFMPNREFYQQPVFTRNTFDWTDRIVQCLHAAGTGVNCAVNPYYLINLEEYARTEKFIVPIDFGDGTDGYVVTLPTPQCTWFKNLVQTGGGGWLWIQASAIDKDVLKKFPGAIGRFNGLMIIEDQRYPTLTLGGSASYGQTGDGYNYTSDSGIDYTLTAQYRGMGRADDGSSDPRDKSASARQIGFLIGQGGICEWMPEGFHWEWDYEQYDKYFGSGIFCSVGMEMPIFDNTDGVDNDDDTVVQQDSSIVLPFCQPENMRTTYYTSAA